LSNVGGEVRVEGDPSFTFPLKQALEAARPSLDDELAIQRFHPYPARMHPAVARTVLEAFDPGADRGRRGEVLDPFCGSGTVLVEAMRGGWRSLGSDLSPLAVSLARLKTRRRRGDARARLLERIDEVAVASEERVRGRVDVRAKLHPSQRRDYDVHVLKELAGLLEEIRAVSGEGDRAALEMVFSTLVIKFSNRRSETDGRPPEQPRRIRKGLVTEFFVRKGRELVEAQAELDAACPAKTHAPRLVLSDTRRLPRTLSGEFRANLIVTSPPYGGTYDYADHHALRMAWLGLDGKALRRNELGARRSYARGGKTAEGREARGGEQAWDAEVLAALKANAALLRPEALAVGMVGDGRIGGRDVRADEQLRRLAPRAGLEVMGIASQPRRDYAGGKPRQEHLVAFLRDRSHPRGRS
jgi:hypothetical protein